ncbi:DeoR family transcriptional regulator [Spirochaetia bacterium]|nr:DeoR family transcriptional regulator [Spirochaetia bacterium]
MSKFEDRTQQLLHQLIQVKSMRMEDIEEKFDVSLSTARRMCLDLENKGKAFRNIGGIQYIPENIENLDKKYSYVDFSTRCFDEKQAIARRAADLVIDREIIFISGGTTAAHFSKALAEKIHREKMINLIVVTNAFDNADILGGETRVIVTGGNYRTMRRDLAGIICEKTIQKSHFNRSFVGVDGIDIEEGLMTFDIDTAKIDQLVIASSDHSYILTDHTKFKRSSFISYSRIRDNCTIITDKGILPDVAEKAAGCGINLVVV